MGPPETALLGISELLEDESELSILGKQCLIERDPHSIGKLLEKFFESAVFRDKRFKIVKKHSRTETGEFDYVIKQSIADGFWRFSPYIVTECKNWADAIGPSQLDHFIALIKKSRPFCNIGVYVTTSRLTPAAWTTLRDARIQDEITVVVIESDSFASLAQGLGNVITSMYEKQTFKSEP